LVGMITLMLCVLPRMMILPLRDAALMRQLRLVPRRLKPRSAQTRGDRGMDV
jgi:hypothetical protein